MIVNTFIVPNPPHENGDHCLSQVLTLGENFVDVVIVAGIGRKPLLACLQAGMRVFAGEDRADRARVVQAFVDVELVPVGNDATACTDALPARSSRARSVDSPPRRE